MFGPYIYISLHLPYYPENRTRPTLYLCCCQLHTELWANTQQSWAKALSTHGDHQHKQSFFFFFFLKTDFSPGRTLLALKAKRGRVFSGALGIGWPRSTTLRRHRSKPGGFFFFLEDESCFLAPTTSSCIFNSMSQNHPNMKDCWDLSKK